MDIICYNNFMELYIEMNGMELHEKCDAHLNKHDKFKNDLLTHLNVKILKE